MMEHYPSIKPLECTVVGSGVVVKVEEEEPYNPHNQLNSVTNSDRASIRHEVRIKNERSEDMRIRKSGKWEYGQALHNNIGCFKPKQVVIKTEEEHDGRWIQKEELCDGGRGLSNTADRGVKRDIKVKLEEDDRSYGMGDHHLEERDSSPPASPDYFLVQVKEEEEDLSFAMDYQQQGQQVVHPPTCAAGREREPRIQRMPSKMFINIAQLIQMVQERPEIYDPKVPSYADRYKKKKAWDEICSVVVPDWEMCGEKEKNIRAKEIQTRWRSLKDCFRRELTLQKKLENSGIPTNKRRKYIHYDGLLFLEPTMKLRESCFTTEELITRIQEHPELFDRKHPGYKDTSKTNLVWADIAAEFLEDIWDELSDPVKADNIEQLRTRWKSVRDNYRRELDKQKNEERRGVRATNRRKYKFTAILDFLKPHTETGATEDNFPNEETTEGQPTEEDITEPSSVDTSETSVQEADDNLPMHSPESPSTHYSPTCTHNVSYRFRQNLNKRRAGRGISRAEYDQKLITSIEKAVTHMEKRENQSTESREPCSQFLMSLVPSFKKVPPEKMLAAQRAIIDTIERFITPEPANVPQEQYYSGHTQMLQTHAPYRPPLQQPYYEQQTYDHHNQYYPTTQHSTQRLANPYYSLTPQPMNQRASSPQDNFPETPVFTDLSGQQSVHTRPEENSHVSETTNMSQLLFLHDM